MRKLIIAALATVAVFSGTVTTKDSMANDIATGVWVWATSERADPADRSTQAMRYRAWLALCFDYRPGVGCTGLDVPKINYFRPNPFRPGLAGYYDGGDTVHLRRGMKYTEREEVMLHEMSHYLDQQRGLAKIPVYVGDEEGLFLLCKSEATAWGISDAFWIRQGYSPDSSKIVGSKWADWYTHCTPFKDRLYPDEADS